MSYCCLIAVCIAIEALTGVSTSTFCIPLTHPPVNARTISGGARCCLPTSDRRCSSFCLHSFLVPCLHCTTWYIVSGSKPHNGHVGSAINLYRCRTVFVGTSLCVNFVTCTVLSLCRRCSALCCSQSMRLLLGVYCSCCSPT